MKKQHGLAFFLSACLLLPATLPVAATTPQPETVDGFWFDMQKVRQVWVNDADRVIATGGWNALGPEPEVSDKITEPVNYSCVYLTALAPVAAKPEQLGKPLSSGGVSGMELLTVDDEKYFYDFYEYGVTVAKALQGQEAGTATAYLVNSKAYEQLLKSLRDEMVNGPWSPLWLTHMRDSKGKSVTIAVRGQMHTYTRGVNHFYTMVFEGMTRFWIEPDNLQIMENAKIPKTGNLIQISFNNKIVYTLSIERDYLTVYSNDRTTALRYKLKESNRILDELESMAKGKVSPNTAKPVIYLYPEAKTDLSVKLNFRGVLGYTDPLYRDGWEVTAWPDGRIVNRADGKEYNYLYWDGNNNTEWNFSTGFSVAGKDTEAFLLDKLSYLGLNEKEYTEFIAYWLPEMQQNAYNLITFSTEQYASLAPLTISPAPDHLLRVHMVYRAVDAPVAIAEQKLEKFVRSGFTVVEWGGSRA